MFSEDTLDFDTVSFLTTIRVKNVHPRITESSEGKLETFQTSYLSEH